MRGELPAVSSAGFNGPAFATPFGHTAAVDPDLFARNLGVTQQEGGKFAVFTVPAIAVDDDFLGHHACGKDGGKVGFVAVIIQLPGSGNVSLLIVVIVAGINKENQALLIAGVLKEFVDLVAIGEAKTFLLEPGGDFGSQNR